jgi:hypothetical protein
MDVYKWVLPFTIFIMFFWNVTMLVITSISIRDCLVEANLLFGVGIMIFIESITHICLFSCCCFLILCMVMFAPRNEELAALRRRKQDKRLIVNIITQLKKLIANQDNFKPDDDECCICMDKMKLDQHVVYLP